MFMTWNWRTHNSFWRKKKQLNLRKRSTRREKVGEEVMVWGWKPVDGRWKKRGMGTDRMQRKLVSHDALEERLIGTEGLDAVETIWMKRERVRSMVICRWSSGWQGLLESDHRWSDCSRRRRTSTRRCPFRWSCRRIPRTAQSRTRFWRRCRCSVSGRIAFLGAARFGRAHRSDGFEHSR